MSNDTAFGGEFFARYSRLLREVWGSDAEEARLTADPTAYAIEHGLPVDTGARVSLDRSQPDGLFSREQIISAWTANPGVHTLHVPSTPVVELAELSDAELDAVGGGYEDNNIIYNNNPGN